MIIENCGSTCRNDIHPLAFRPTIIKKECIGNLDQGILQKRDHTSLNEHEFDSLGNTDNYIDPSFSLKHNEIKEYLFASPATQKLIRKISNSNSPTDLE